LENPEKLFPEILFRAIQKGDVHDVATIVQENRASLDEIFDDRGTPSGLPSFSA
jgi:hypothetical protein